MSPCKSPVLATAFATDPSRLMKEEEELDRFRGDETQLSEDSGRDKPAKAGVLGAERSGAAAAPGLGGEDEAGDGI